VSHDTRSFAEFYQASKDDCVRTVVASTGDHQAAEDAVAEAFTRAWAAWRTVSQHPAPRAWVVRTALNANVSWWRRRRREAFITDTDHPGAGLGGVADAPGSASSPPDGPVDQAIMAALRGLPARQREVIALRIFLDLDTAQTAEVLGIAPGTVTAHLARAMAALRAEIVPAEQKEITQ
jgi:RNA polymerase sigma-70 factor (sigma-E family)